MTDADIRNTRHICSAFESQTWRKSLCKNCFHSLDEHSDDLLAQEAEKVAKEKADAKPQSTPTLSNQDLQKAQEMPPVAVKNVKDSRCEKEKSPVNAKGKPGASKVSAKEEGRLCRAKDTPQENGKPIKPGAPVIPKTPKAIASMPTSTSSLTTSIIKSPLKSVTSSLSASKVVVTSSPTTLAISNAITSTSSSKPATTESQKTLISKTKNFASKFESKASLLTKDKPSKPSDNLNIVTNNNKSTDGSSDTKPTQKPSPVKQTDDPKINPVNNDLKTSQKILNEEGKSTASGCKVLKPEPAKINGSKFVSQTGDKNDSKNTSRIRSSGFPNKQEIVDSKPSTSLRTKATSLGKDVLRTTNDSTKQSNASPDFSVDKPKSPMAKDGGVNKNDSSAKTTTAANADKDKANLNPKTSLTKLTENKRIGLQQEVESPKSISQVKGSAVNQEINSNNRKMAANSVRSSLSPEHAQTATFGNTGQVSKITGKIVDGKSINNSASSDISKTIKDKSDKKEPSPTKDTSNINTNKLLLSRGKREGSVEKKNDTPASSLACKQPSPSANPQLSKTASTAKQNVDSKPIPSASESKNSQHLKLDISKEAKSPQNSLDKLKGIEKTKDKSSDKQAILSPTKSPSLSFPPSSKKKDDFKNEPVDMKDVTKLEEELREKDEKLLAVSTKLLNLEQQIKVLEQDRDQLREDSAQSQRRETEKLLNDLRTQLSDMDSRCSRLEKDNQSLIDKLHDQETSVKRDQKNKGKNFQNVNLEEDLEAAERELEEVKGVNNELQEQIMEMKNEMDEMYDHFRESEHEEFRDLQKELDMTAKNCRLLQFKLRKAERCNEQIEEDRIHYEEKLRMLQDQFDSKDAKNHIRVLEEELRVAKEVSVRLHDEMDLVEEKRNKALEDNRHLTELLEHTDRRQFRLEMEIDKLRDMVADLKQQLKEAKNGNNNSNNNNNNNKESTPDRKDPVPSTSY